MRTATITALTIALGLSACARRDEPAARQVGREAYRAGQDIKKGAKEAAKELREAGKNLREGYKEARREDPKRRGRVDERDRERDK